ncbi:uncharacterized protein DUF4124 [Alteromonadaceae bacterium 2753L.S.0a.02]|nr:uncharacterized protein DUF4124 [Alteromonadaceae bacterium 2753L.S.0a.02]
MMIAKYTKPLKFHLPSVAALILLLSFAYQANAQDYYRWMGEDGVVHYGSNPPPGVEAEKIKTHGGPKKAPDTANNDTAPGVASETDTANLPPEEMERRRKVAEAQKRVCEDEKNRLEVLNKPTRIRMKQPDGSTKILSQDEVMKEIQTSKKLIEENCN